MLTYFFSFSSHTQKKLMLFCVLKIVLQKSSAYISGLGFPRENFIPLKNDYTGFPFSYQDYSVFSSSFLCFVLQYSYALSETKPFYLLAFSRIRYAHEYLSCILDSYRWNYTCCIHTLYTQDQVELFELKLNIIIEHFFSK